VIAADRGAAHARAWGWPLDLLVGDLDSLPAEDGAAISAGGTPVITAPAAKDETDTELALAHALAQEPREIIICAALGGRADHMLANVLLLARPELAQVRVTLTDGRESIRLLRGAGPAPTHLELPGAPGDLLSLLPLGQDAIGVTTKGLQYPLRAETLLLGQARGVSNVFTGFKATIMLRCGSLLVIHTSTDR
jgi:thiamine pyrophosphokinase